MSKPKNAFEVFRFLDKSNCGECGEKTCLAFAGAVFLGQRRIRECPTLSREALERFAGEPDPRSSHEASPEDRLEKLKSEVVHLDLAKAAERMDAVFSGSKLTLKVLGKDFSVDEKGNLATEIHINPWVAAPFLSYILYGQGLPVAGKWVPYRELGGGRDGYPLFQKRCEEPMKKVADVYTPLFDDIVHVFGGKQVDKQFESDISVVLYPLPKVPVMICYWLPEDGMDSSLHIFFDETADRNLDIGSVFTLGTGLAQMFTKIALRHGFDART
ncbi:MAG: DUF3786 domain-containing protein [Desulfobacteraceae bacterium]|nr:MAG: DUF3786 domain-containing protein [Desulfobacteraceae bacterium]